MKNRTNSEFTNFNRLSFKKNKFPSDIKNSFTIGDQSKSESRLPLNDVNVELVNSINKRYSKIFAGETQDIIKNNQSKEIIYNNIVNLNNKDDSEINSDVEDKSVKKSIEFESNSEHYTNYYNPNIEDREEFRKLSKRDKIVFTNI